MRVLVPALLALLLAGPAASADVACIGPACAYDWSDERCGGHSGATGVQVDSALRASGWRSCTKDGRFDLVTARAHAHSTEAAVAWYGTRNATELRVDAWHPELDAGVGWSADEDCDLQARVVRWDGTEERRAVHQGPCPADAPPPSPPPLPWGRFLP